MNRRWAEAFAKGTGIFPRNRRPPNENRVSKLTGSPNYSIFIFGTDQERAENETVRILRKMGEKFLHIVDDQSRVPVYKLKNMAELPILQVFLLLRACKVL